MSTRLKEVATMQQEIEEVLDLYMPTLESPAHIDTGQDELLQLTDVRTILALFSRAPALSTEREGLKTRPRFLSDIDTQAKAYALSGAPPRNANLVLARAFTSLQVASDGDFSCLLRALGARMAGRLLIMNPDDNTLLESTQVYVTDKDTEGHERVIVRRFVVDSQGEEIEAFFEFSTE